MRVPALRFKDDDGREFANWEVKILSKLVSTSITYGVVKPDVEDVNGVKLIRGGDVSQGKINPNLRTIRNDISQQYKRTILQGGELVVSLVGNPGEVAIVPQELKGSNLARQVGLVRLNIDLNSSFILHCLTFSTKLITAKITGSVQKVINLEDLQKLEIKIPVIAEQTKIANFLTAVDEKITQLTQKHDLLIQYKKGAMQQIFSQELRFKDDDGQDFPDWKKVTLDDVLDYEQPTKYLVSSTEYSDSFNTPVLTAGKTFILGYTDETTGICDQGLPVIIFDDFTTAFKFVTFPFKAKSSAMKVLRKKSGVNISYIYSAMQLIDFPSGDEHKRYWISEYSKVMIPLPCGKEQTKIANFLTAIDDKITVTHTQFQAVKHYKQGLLQQMFV